MSAFIGRWLQLKASSIINSLSPLQCKEFTLIHILSRRAVPQFLCLKLFQTAAHQSPQEMCTIISIGTTKGQCQFICRFCDGMQLLHVSYSRLRSALWHFIRSICIPCGQVQAAPLYSLCTQRIPYLPRTNFHFRNTSCVIAYNSISKV